MVLDGTPDTEVVIQDRRAVLPGVASPPLDFLLDDAFLSITGHVASTCITGSNEPTTVADAFARPDGDKWRAALDAEVESLQANSTWTLVLRDNVPKSARILKTKVVFKIKHQADGTIERYKARVVVKGFLQRPGLDYSEVFSPVVHFDTVRVLLSLAASFNLDVQHMDFQTAFLNSEIKEELYMEVPDGVPNTDAQGRQLVCKLNKSIYGLKQAPRCWNELLNDWMLQQGFARTDADPCLYVRAVGDNIAKAMLVTVWVDDLIIVTGDAEALVELKTALTTKFKMKDLGKIAFCLGMEIKREPGKLTLHQSKYIRVR